MTNNRWRNYLGYPPHLEKRPKLRINLRSSSLGPAHRIAARRRKTLAGVAALLLVVVALGAVAIRSNKASTSGALTSVSGVDYFVNYERTSYRLAPSSNLTGARMGCGFPDYEEWDCLDYREKDLNHANFTNAILQSAHLEGTNLTGATFTGTKLAGANLDGANLSEITAEGTDFWGSPLTGANLTNAKLTRAGFFGYPQVASNSAVRI